MADIVSSVIKGSSRTVSDASKVALNAMLAQPKMMLQFYKAVPVLGKLIENSAKEYKKTSIAHVKSINQNTTAISALNKSLNNYTQKLKGTAPSPTSQVTPTTEGSTLGKVAMVGLIAAAIANDRVRESALSVAEIAVKGVFKTFMGSDEYKRMEEKVTDNFNKIFKTGENIGKGIKVAADALSPVVTMLNGVTRFIGRLAGAEGDIQETVAGGLIGGAGLYALSKASPLLNFLGARSGAKKGIAAGLGQAAGQSLAINATNVYINAGNVVGGPGSVVNPSQKGRGAPGRAPAGKPTIRGSGRFGAAGSILAAIAAGLGVSDLLSDQSNDGQEGGETGSSNLGLYGGLAAGAGAYFAPSLIQKYYQSKMTNVPGVGDLVLKDSTTRTTPTGKKITSYPTEENRIARENYEKQMKQSRRAEAINILNQRKAQNLIKYAKGGTVGVGIGLSAIDYIQQKYMLDKQLDAGQITTKQYEEQLTQLKGQVTGGAVGAAVGMGIGSFIMPGVGTVLGGVVGGMIGSIAGERYSAPTGSNSSPVSSSNLTDVLPYGGYKNRSDFEQALGPWAAKAAEQLKAPPEAILAQWGLETAWGRKGAIQGKYNYGNIQGTYRKKYTMGTDAGRSRAFVDYDSMGDFIDDYVKQLKRSRYNLGQEQVSADRFFQTLKNGGYAEDPDYVAKLNKIMGGVSPIPTSSNVGTPQNPTMRSLSLGGNLTGVPVDTSTRIGAEAMRMFDEFKQIQLGAPQQSSPMMLAPPAMSQSSSEDLSPIPSPSSPRYLGLIAKEQFPFYLGGA